MSLQYIPDDFNTGLCECFDDQPSCVASVFCPWCALKAQLKTLMRGRTRVVPHACVPLIVMNFLLWGGIGIGCFSVLMRNMVRRSFLLSAESEANSCFKAFFCVHCSVSQVYREMSIRHEWPGGPCVEEPYVRQNLVVPPPNPERMGEAGATSPQTTVQNPIPNYRPNIIHMTAVEVRLQPQGDLRYPQPQPAPREEGDEPPAFQVDTASQHPHAVSTTVHVEEHHNPPLKPVYGYES